MASIGEYRNDIKRYRALKEKIAYIIGELNSGSENANKLSNEVAGSFKINNIPAKVTSRIDILNRSMAETANYLNDTILPSLDRAIDNAHDDIERLKEED
ncbi:hypothetical protein IJV57_05030 [Candidatus Saccharibacteria bacterium]|nr:hypothetical protein [Candidatus Saccharibacteria bacterium]